MVFKIDGCSKREAAGGAIGETPIIKVAVTGGAAVNFDEVLQLQVVSVQRDWARGKLTTRKIIQDKIRLDDCDEDANLYLATRAL